MGLLSSIFGSSKKTTTTATTTNATQTSIDNTGGVYATGSSLDFSSVTDSRSWEDNRVDARQWDNSVTTVIDPSAEVMAEVAAFGLAQNLRLLDSVDALSATGVENARDFLTASGALFSDAAGLVERNTGTLVNAILASDARDADLFNRSTAAIVEANRSDGQQVLATVENMTKYVVIGIAALAAFATLKG